MLSSTKAKISRAKGMVDAQSTQPLAKYISQQQTTIYTFLTSIVDEIENTPDLDQSGDDADAIDALNEAASILINIDGGYNPDDFDAAVSTASDLLADARS